MEERENEMKQKKTGISAEKQEQWILQGKYVILAVLVGICVGIVDTIFGRGLLTISDFREQYYRYLLPILPVAGLAIVWMYQRFSSLSLKGMTLVFEVGQKKREEIPLAFVPLVMIGTWITHLFGGSAGREGVAVQIGATLSHETGRRLHIKETKPVMLITGMTAGFGGLFQTPLAAVFFAMEVGVSGYVEYDALLPALIASYTASTTSHLLGLEKFAVDVQEIWQIGNIKNVVILVILGLAFGLTGRCFSVLLQKTKKLAGDKISNPLVRIGCLAIPLAIVLMGITQCKIQWTGNQPDHGILYRRYHLPIRLDPETFADDCNTRDWLSGWRGNTVIFHWCVIGCGAWFCVRNFAGHLRVPWLCSSIWQCNQHGNCTDSDRTGSLWKPECDPSGCGLPAGIYGQWKSFDLWGTGEGAVQF